MILSELLKKPVEIFTENNISEDILLPNQMVSDLVKKILDLEKDKHPDFLTVCADQVEKAFIPNAVITNRELKELTDYLIEFGKTNDYTNTPMRNLRLENKFPPKFKLNKEDTAEQAYNIFKSDMTDIVIVLDKGKYIGKLRRNQFVQRIKTLLD